ncbi:MAG: thermonuclease family protein [Gammaproteobacteria bacterium]|nr:thermonuclease family protein [Gammaproteobacteria bacterium]
MQYVYDGDTLILKDGRKLRLIGIDAPEMAHESNPAEPLATAARDFVRQQLRSNSKIQLQYDNNQQDQYGRTLAHVFLANGENLNAQLLKKGLAALYIWPPNTTYAHCYEQAQRDAIQRQQGLWQLPAYAAQPLSQPAAQQKLPRRYRGTLKNVQRTRQGLDLLLIDGQDSLKLYIPQSALVYFDLSSLDAMRDKALIVQGITHCKPQKTQCSLRLSHPSQIQFD